jgi:hypothetical protein
MRYALKLSVGLALLCALASGEALARSGKSAPPAPAATSADDDFPIPLPHNLLTGQDWLDDGAAAAAQADEWPNRYANDNYFIEQQDFAEQDPLRFTEFGEIFDGR